MLTSSSHIVSLLFLECSRNLPCMDGCFAWNAFSPSFYLVYPSHPWDHPESPFPRLQLSLHSSIYFSLALIIIQHTIIYSILFIIFCVPQEMKDLWGKRVLSVLVTAISPCLEQFLAHNKHSTNICGNTIEKGWMILFSLITLTLFLKIIHGIRRCSFILLHLT